MFLLNQGNLSRITRPALETITFKPLVEIYLHFLKPDHGLTARRSYSDPLHLPNLGKRIQQYLQRA